MADDPMGDIRLFQVCDLFLDQSKVQFIGNGAGSNGDKPAAVRA
jgi:hypothetical protein